MATRQDPVSQKERDRNEAIYKVQHNRNPYIDNADYAEYVWGGQTPSGVSITGITASPDLTNETSTVKISATVVGTNNFGFNNAKMWIFTPSMGNEIVMNKTTEISTDQQQIFQHNYKIQLFTMPYLLKILMEEVQPR